jgi:hypothetical protein
VERPPANGRKAEAPLSASRRALTRWTREPLKGFPHRLISLIVFENGHISGALAELIRSTRAPTKDRLKGKIMSGNPVFRGTRVPVHMLAELVPSHAVPEGKCDGTVRDDEWNRAAVWC